jgi:hypothetical protein
MCWNRWLAVALILFVGCQRPEAETLDRSDPSRHAPTLDVTAPEEYVGYGAEVELRAVAADPDGDEIQVTWRQVSGLPVDIEGGPGGRVTFRTHELDQSAPPVDGPLSVLQLTPERAGHYRFQVEASDGVETTTITVDVRAGPASPGWPRTVQGQPTYLDAGIDQERYDWTVIFAPPRTEPRFDRPTVRRPTITLSYPGRYIVRENVSGRELSLHSGPWMGTEQCGRIECHPVEAEGWATTKMATVLQRGLDGQLRSDYSRECLRCHTVGWDETVDNEGFDDIAETVDWEIPRRLQPGNYAKLPFALSDRGNVGCEACHGPGRFYTSYAAAVCATCHEHAPDYVNPIEWRRSPMAQIRDGVSDRPECRRCHTAQGFIDEFFGHRPVQETARVEDAQYELEPITCAACHDTHQGQNERLVRYGGPLYGQEPDVDWGTGMICLGCHQGGSQWSHPRGALMRPFVPRVHGPIQSDGTTLWDQRVAPHAPQGDMIRGRAGHALPGPGPLEAGPPHLGVPGGCLGCHVTPRPPEGDPRQGLVGGHTFAMFSGEGPDRVENTEACAPCHGELDSLSRQARHDYDGNGRREGIFEEVEGLLALAKVAVDQAILQADIRDGARRAASFTEYDGHLVLVDAEGSVLGTATEPMTFPADQDRLFRAVYNYALVLKDRSRGVHNPVWTVRLLQRTILRLAPREVPRWYWR